MADEGAISSAPGRLRRRMVGRNFDEAHRPSTPLELLVDLCFVVAVAQVAAALHYAVADDHIGAAVVGYLSVFFAIWWAWMNFTWFASAFDVDDLPYRLLTLMQMAGILVLAAGVPAAFETGDFTTITIGYVIVRIALVAQWLRVAADSPASRAVALRYAFGITLLQIGWIGRLFLPASTDDLTFVLLVIGELAVPIWADRVATRTLWHPGHIAERYGLFTIIVLGESILAGTLTVQAALDEAGPSWSLTFVAMSALVLIFGMWWCYFARPADDYLRTSPQSAFLWGYAHYVVFASVAAVGAGLQVVAETSEGADGLSDAVAALSVALPLALFLVVLGVLQSGIDGSRRVAVRYLAGALAILTVAGLAETLTLPGTVLAMAGVISVLVGLAVADDRPA